MHPLFSEYTTTQTSNRWQVCLADCQDHLTYERLADLLYTESPRQLEQTDLLIVRPSVDTSLSENSFDLSEFAPLTKRAPHASLHVLFSEKFEIRLSSNLNPLIQDKLASGELKDDCLRWLQDKELYTFIKRSSAVFQAHTKFVYRAPSKRYVNMFLRVGNIQRTRQILDAFFFWMLPYLRDRTAILTDTWSISSIALNASRMLERYWASFDRTENGTTARVECHIDMLSSYPDDLLAVMPETQETIRRVSGNGVRNVLVLISAVATGTSLQRLRETVAAAQIREEEFRFLSLYKLEDGPDIPTLCDISQGVGDMKFTPIQRDEIQDRTVIEIDRSAYFPLEIKETPLMISKEHAAPAKEFFSEYQYTGAIALHRDSVDLSHQVLRHHGIYIDVCSMVRHQSFIGKVRNAIGRVQCVPLIVVVPPHAAGRALSELVNQILLERWGAAPNLLISPDLRSAEKGMLHALMGADSRSEILVVDDVSITGQRLARYQQSLRELNFRGHITYLVGVARPESDKTWNRRVKELRFRSGETTPHEVISIEKIVLPDWDQRSCPWCLEAKSLAKIVEQGRLAQEPSQRVIQRIMRLESSKGQDGLIDDAIWQPNGASELRLTHNSLFLDVHSDRCSEATVIAAVAAAIQQMRISGSDEMRLEATYPHVTVLSPENYFGSRFNDDLLRLAVLRSARSTELELWNNSEEEGRRESVRHFLYEHENSETFMLELAVARLANKVPQPILDDIAKKAHSWTGELWRFFADPSSKR